MEGLGLFFLVAINIVGGLIYLRFSSLCNDKEKRQLFEKGCNFDILELTKAYKSIATYSFEIVVSLLM